MNHQDDQQTEQTPAELRKWHPEPYGLFDSTQEPLYKQSVLSQKPNENGLPAVLLVYAMCWIASLTYWFSSWGQYNLPASQNSVFLRHEYWRLLTAVFTHSGVKHLLSNTLLFVVFAWSLRSFFGRLAFPLFPLIIGIMTNLLTVWQYPAHTRLVGASGMVYGMVGMWLVLYMRYDFRYSFFRRLFRVVGFSLVLLIPTVYSPTTSYLAHGIGFVLGITGSFFIWPKKSKVEG